MIKILKDAVENRLDIRQLDAVLKKGWDIKDGNHALIITDMGNGQDTSKNMLAPSLALEEFTALKKLGCICKVYVQQPKKTLDTIDEKLINKIDSLTPESIVIVSVSDSIGMLPDRFKGKTFKAFVLERGLRLIFSRSLSEVKKEDINTFVQAICFDTKDYMKRWIEIKKILDTGKKMTIRTEEGTELSLDISDRLSYLNCGDYRYKSTNLPFGEIYIAPVENKSCGTVVIDGTSKTLSGSKLIKDSFMLKFKNGRLTENTSHELSSTISKILEKDQDSDKSIEILAELGIGLNTKAELIGLMLLDEKTYGTAHIAIGANTSFGGKNRCSHHFDQIFKNPKIWVDEKRLDI